MKHRITLITELESEMHKQGYSLSHFSKVSGINRGILSATLNGNPPKLMSITQLDTMTSALGKPESWLYELFIEQCFSTENKANWRRVRALLLRCIELNRTDLISDILNSLMEDPAQVAHVFEFAEELVKQNQTVVAVPFYECVIENERNYHSERLAISHYRLFRARISPIIENNLRLAMVFHPFHSRLPDHLRLEALVKLANIYYTVQDWNMIITCADELNILSNIIYKQECKKRKRNLPVTTLDLEMPLVAYYAQSHLMKFAALEHTECYEEARLYLKEFSDLSWFEGLDEAGIQYVERTRIYAQFNTLNLDLLMGDTDKLANYLELLASNPGEVLPSLLIISKAANKHSMNIDHILECFDEVIYPSDILDYIHHGKFLKDHYKDIPVGISRYINIYYQLALYQCNRNVYDEKLERILLALETSVEKYNRGRIMDCLELFKKLREMPRDNKDI